jgi:hypothetical protein
MAKTSRDTYRHMKALGEFFDELTSIGEEEIERFF